MRTIWKAFIIIFLLFLLFNLVWVESGWVGGMCMRAITGPGEEDHPMHSWRTFGFPFRFLYIHQDGCFEDRETQTEFVWSNLVIDVIFMLTILAISGSVITLWQRRKAKITQKEMN